MIVRSHSRMIVHFQSIYPHILEGTGFIAVYMVLEDGMLISEPWLSMMRPITPRAKFC